MTTYHTWLCCSSSVPCMITYPAPESAPDSCQGMLAGTGGCLTGSRRDGASRNARGSGDGRQWEEEKSRGGGGGGGDGDSNVCSNRESQGAKIAKSCRIARRTIKTRIVAEFGKTPVV
jgi:hypothetical protein